MIDLATKSDPETRPPAASRLPNFLYIGTSKAGSTWLYHVLAEHPDVFIAPGKGAYFFDHHYERGWEWYRQQFHHAGDAAVVGEISHSYLFSDEAARRIAETLSGCKLMVCLREPVERAFSAYLDTVKNGQFSGSFEEALEQNPSLIDRGRYATHLSRYFELFPRDRCHVAIFDDLKADPQRFANELFAFLGIAPRELPAAKRRKVMPAARPRSRAVAQLAKRFARLADRVGFRGLRGRVKRSRWVRNLLYRPYRADELPQMDPATRQRLRETFRNEVARLDEMVGTNLRERWNY